jgi:ankyrin repeat protein
MVITGAIIIALGIGVWAYNHRLAGLKPATVLPPGSPQDSSGKPGTPGNGGAAGGLNHPDQSSLAARLSALTVAARSEGELYPNELVRNPYGCKDKVVQLKLSEVPVMVAGQRMLTARPVPEVGRVSLSLERSYDPGLAKSAGLYAAIELVSPSDAPSQVGEIMVESTIEDAPADHLDVIRDWQVYCDGAVRGKNQYGGPIDIAVIYFLRYHTGHDDSPSPSVAGTAETNGGDVSRLVDSQNPAPPIGVIKAVDSQGHITADLGQMVCCVYPAELVKHPHEYKDRRYTMIVEPWAIVGQGGELEYRSVPEHKGPAMGLAGISYDHSIDQDETLFKVNIGSGASLTAMGYLAVAAPASLARSLDLTRSWEVDCLGTTHLLNSFGASVDIPKVRFLMYHNPIPFPHWTGIKPTTGVSLDLVRAVRAGDLPLASGLLAKGADPNAHENDADMIPCLGYAMTKSNATSLVRLLLQYKADVNHVSAEGNEPLSYSGEASDEVVNMIIDAGADVRHKNNLGHTPLFEAADRPTPVIVTALLRRGAIEDLNVRDRSTNETPLTSAVRSRRVETVKVLLLSGADPNLAPHDLKPLAIAMELCKRGNPGEQAESLTIAKLLAEHGAAK